MEFLRSLILICNFHKRKVGANRLPNDSGVHADESARDDGKDSNDPPYVDETVLCSMRTPSISVSPLKPVRCRDDDKQMS